MASTTNMLVTTALSTHAAQPTIVTSVKALRDRQVAGDDMEHIWKFGYKSSILSLTKPRLYQLLLSKSPDTQIVPTELKAVIFQEIQCLVRASFRVELHVFTLLLAAEGRRAD